MAKIKVVEGSAPAESEKPESVEVDFYPENARELNFKMAKETAEANSIKSEE